MGADNAGGIFALIARYVPDGTFARSVSEITEAPIFSIGAAE